MDPRPTPEQTAATLADAMRDTRAGTLTPDGYRAIVREHRPNFTDGEWSRITFAAAARDSQKLDREEGVN